MKEVPRKADGLSSEGKQTGFGHDEYPADFLNGENEVGGDLKEMALLEAEEKIKEHNETVDDPDDNESDVNEPVYENPDELGDGDEELEKNITEMSEELYITPLAKDRPMASCYSNSFYLKNCKGAKKWTGGWPLALELPEDQRRDTACPYTFRNETRKRIKRWPDIIGVGIAKCGTGRR